MALYYAVLKNTCGKEIPLRTYMVAFSDHLKYKRELLKTSTKDFPLSGKLFWRTANKEIAIEKLSITGYLINIDNSFQSSFSTD